MHVLECLSSLRHGSGLDPRADLVVDGELEEFVEFLGSSDQGSSQRDTLSDESVSVHGGELLLGETTEDESSFRSEEFEEEGFDGEVVVVGSADDEVELASPLLGGGSDVLVDDEVIGVDTELFSVGNLRQKAMSVMRAVWTRGCNTYLLVRVRESEGLSTESVGDLKTKVT